MCWSKPNKTCLFRDDVSPFFSFVLCSLSPLLVLWTPVYIFVGKSILSPTKVYTGVQRTRKSFEHTTGGEANTEIFHFFLITPCACGARLKFDFDRQNGFDLSFLSSTFDAVDLDWISRVGVLGRVGTIAYPGSTHPTIPVRRVR